MSTLTIALTLFVFALIIGVIVIGKVPATLHTPLMSGANSIHGVVIVGVVLVAVETSSVLGLILIFFAAVLGTANVVGGYTVTDRMLDMFKAKPKPAADNKEKEAK
ncbi:MAG: NAD(P) transhydrogenase subunit alpha [Endomicrobium sp.]|jgi:NAD(P) transhydrogenase subunit alpha|nr:NAD(P) transhydrogenase subunit alpha [Endomicrobium sp.]